MTWLLYAILAHAGNGIVSIIDKGILGSNSAISNPLRMAFITSTLSGGAGLLFVVSWTPLTGTLFLWSLIAGVFFALGLLLFYRALKIGEASSVVPLIGSVVPLCSFFLSVIFLEEHLSSQAVFAVILLIIGGTLLSMRFSSLRLSPPLLSSLGSGFCFAVHFITAKVVYNSFEPFLAAFAYVRVMVAVAGIVLFGIPLLLLSRRRSGPVRNSQRSRGISISVACAFVVSKSIAAGSLILQNYAILVGSVAVVNALHGIQYGVILLLALIGSRYVPHLYPEPLNTNSIAKRVIGILLVSSGLVLLATTP